METTHPALLANDDPRLWTWRLAQFERVAASLKIERRHGFYGQVEYHVASTDRRSAPYLRRADAEVALEAERRRYADGAQGCRDRLAALAEATA